ncbi:DUF4331 family protein [Actinoplanes sp. NPDC048791]|uniref:DUF4331 family protein n=1 Tax=Actinoplanes sp. NPDC048791 TaxID=3154623 RepID=UPI0033F28C8C
MSHHLDSPLARQDSRLNITDQYVFDDADATVLIMNVRTSLAGTERPLGFHDEARYEFRIHLDDDPVENLTFRLVFQPETGSGAQTYEVSRLEDDAAARDDVAGSVIGRGRCGARCDGPDGLSVWAGRVRDPFFLDLAQLGEVDKLIQHGQDATVTGFLAGQAASTFAGSTVNSIVVRIPHRDSAVFPDRMIRVWSTTRLATDSGGWRQISRAGLPMIWPVFRDAESDTASQANATHPVDDQANYAKNIRDLVAATVRRLGTTRHPDAYADAVTQRLIPDTLPYQVGTPAVFGFTDFNGRCLGDNAPEVVFSLVTNSAVSTGLPAAATSDTRTATFPYVVPAAPAGEA